MHILRHDLARLLALCALLWAAAFGARADEGLDDQRARAHFVAGESHFAAERWADAAREFSLAYELSRRPEMLINLSRAHERGGLLEAAITDLEQLLARHPNTPYRGEARQRTEAMRARLDAEARAAEAATTTPATPDIPAVAATQTESVPEAPAPRERRVLWPPRWPVLAVGGTAVAAAVVALATGLRAHGYYGDLESRCPDGRCPSGFEDDRARGRALARASTALTFASVALAGATAVLWVYEGRRRERPLALGFDGAGARVRARF